MSTKYFTPEFRADANYTLDYNHPEDDTLGGSTETFRSDEFQLEQFSFGGDIRIDNVRGRIPHHVRHVRHDHRRATTAALTAASGILPTLTSTSPRHGADITGM